jgi:3-phenylpropionate/cinnamic acid dioxygenase small subunit
MTPDAQDLLRFVVREARLLDEGRYDEWLELFAEDGHYWVPLVHGQTDPVLHNSLAYEDTLLLRLRVERLKSPRAFSQQPPSRCHHVLQLPEVDRLDHAANTYGTRTPLLYSETRADNTLRLAATVFHTLSVIDGALRIRLKRVDLLECETALPSVQLFV